MLNKKNDSHVKIMLLSVLIIGFQTGLALAAGSLLCDAGFEFSEPNGGFPDSGCWSTDFGYAACTPTAARLGINGLWLYTGFATDIWQSQVNQLFPAAPGRRYFASAWVRTSFSDSQWLIGSRALIRLTFLDAAQNTLAEYTSSDVSSPDIDWALLYFASNPAPANTRYVRFSLCLEKPESFGISIVNFDDCILREYESGDCIRLDEIPVCGSSEPLKGSVVGVNPENYKVGVYLFVDDWWPKPTFAAPWTDIASDGSWQCDISTSVHDLDSTEVMAFLVPVNEIADWPVNFNNQTGLSALPGEAFRFPVAGAFRPSCFCKEIEFAGFRWLVKDSTDRKVGPGPNLFDCDNVWVDEQGLHLKITNVEGQWRCAELFSKDSFGSGTYTFELDNSAASLDSNVILGLFTWDQFAPHYSNREIDFELGQWSDPSAYNTQYVIQPWDKTGRLHRFDTNPAVADSITHILEWGYGLAAFDSFYGSIASSSVNEPFESWVYAGIDVPRPGSENIRINLWLNEGLPPQNGSEVEVLIKDFQVNPCAYDVSPAALDFDSVLISKTSAKTVTVANNGLCVPYTVTIDINGPDADNFLVADRAFSLEPNSTKLIDVTFIPDSSRVFEASLNIKSNAGVVTIPLSGRGVRFAYTRIPAAASSDYLEGTASGIDFSDYRVVSYIFVFDKWYIKPLCFSNKRSTNPLVTIDSKGQWKCDVDVEWTDKAATQVASFLVPKYADYPPCVLGSLDDSRLIAYDRISSERPRLSITNIKTSAGKSDDDSIVLDGRYFITMSELLSANQLCLTIKHDDLTVWSQCVPFEAEKFMNTGSFSYVKSGVNIRLDNLSTLLNAYAGNLRVTLKKTDLTCLASPITLDATLGDFKASATADDRLDYRIINGKQDVPIQLLAGCVDALTVDKLTLKGSSKASNDYLYISGSIVCQGQPPDLTIEDVSIGWGSAAFTVPAGSFTKTSRTQPKYSCSKVLTEEGALVYVIIDFKNSSYKIKLKNAKLDTDSENIAFNLLMGGFYEGLSVETGK